MEETSHRGHCSTVSSFPCSGGGGEPSLEAGAAGRAAVPLSREPPAEREGERESS